MRMSPAGTPAPRARVWRQSSLPAGACAQRGRSARPGRPPSGRNARPRLRRQSRPSRPSEPRKAAAATPEPERPSPPPGSDAHLLAGRRRFQGRTRAARKVTRPHPGPTPSHYPPEGPLRVQPQGRESAAGTAPPGRSGERHPRCPGAAPPPTPGPVCPGRQSGPGAAGGGRRRWRGRCVRPSAHLVRTLNSASRGEDAAEGGDGPLPGRGWRVYSWMVLFSDSESEDKFQGRGLNE